LGPANVNQAGAVISPLSDKVLPEFLVHFLLSPVAQDTIHGGKVETARPNISLGDLRDLKVPLPPLSEQKRILAELDTLQANAEASKRLQAETAVELNALMPSVLEKAFEGEF
jgi:type I restriction enzyme S subunit